LSITILFLAVNITHSIFGNFNIN